MLRNSVLKVTLLCILSVTLIGNEILEDEQRLLDSMSIEELLNTDIATSFPMEQNMAPAITSILTSQEITKSGARTLHEALEQVPGLHIYVSDLDSNSPKVSVRGLQSGYNSQLLFLLDGVVLNDLQNGHPGYTFQMPTSMIHRIEVIRGPGSAVYGADAFSGVVNIVMKKHDNIENTVGTRYGSFNTYELWTNQRYTMGDVNLGLSASFIHSDGDENRIVTDSGGKVGPLDTRYTTGYLHADISYKEIAVNLLLEKTTDTGLGIGHKQNLDPSGYVQRDKILLDMEHKSKEWIEDSIVKTALVLSYVNSEAYYNPFNDDENGWKVGHQSTNEYIAGISTNWIYSGMDKHTLNMKVGYEYAFLDPYHYKNFGPSTPDDSAYPAMVDISGDADAAYMLEHTRESTYALIQDEYTIQEDMILTVGARYDNYDDFGSTFNPRFAFVWQTQDTLTVKLMYGRAFRAPTFGELYYINNPAVRGNENLDPETIDTYELAFNLRAIVHTKINFFYYEAKDLIDYVELPDAALGEKTAQNLIDQNAYGVEVEVEYPISEKINLRANYAYQHSEDAKTKEKIANAPQHQFFAQVQHKISQDININLQYFYTGVHYRESDDTRDDIDANSLVNLTLKYKNILKNLDALVGVRNLFDEDYKDPSSLIENDYPMPGRYIFSEMKYRF